MNNSADSIAAQTTPPQALSGLTRRDLLVRSAVGGGLMVGCAIPRFSEAATAGTSTQSALTAWYLARFGRGKRARRVGIVALARKLLIALWRYATAGVLPAGAVVKGA